MGKLFMMDEFVIWGQCPSTTR